MNDDQYFLANAYLDGELTDGERQFAEADPDVMSEVERLRSLQSMLRAAAPPSSAARSSAIAAAMAEFAPTPVVHRETNQARVVPLASRRPAYGRYLSFAAAVLAIGAVGAVLAGQLGGSDDDSSDMTSLESSATFAQNTGPAASREAESEASATTAAGSAADTMNATEMDELAESGIAGSEPAADETVAVEESTGDAVPTTVAAAEAPYPTTGGPIEPLADRDQTITTPGELAGLGVLLGELRDFGELGPTPETRCVFEDPRLEIVDTARYRFADTDATETVLVAIIDDGVDGHTAAIDPESCIVLVYGP